MKKIILLITLTFFITVELPSQISYAQVSCVDGKVVCTNNGTPHCTYGGTPVCNKCGDGVASCLSASTLASGFSCGSITLNIQCLNLCDPGYAVCRDNSGNPTTCCLYGCCPLDPSQCKCSNNDRCEPFCGTTTYTCDSGFITCPPNKAPTDPNGKCCLNGCCPSDPTKCKCQFTDECYPNCSPIYSCKSGYATCPSNIAPTDPNGLCCLNGCCPSDPTKCKCPTNDQCIPNCTLLTPAPPPKYKCNADYKICPNDITPTAVCCLNGCCPSDPTKCKCQFNDQCYPNCSTEPSCQSCTNSAQCSLGKYCDLNTQCCKENSSGCAVGCTNNGQCFGNSICSSNCCISKTNSPTSPSIDSISVPLSPDFTGIWKGSVPKSKSGQSRFITFRVCVVSGELDGLVNQRGVINNGEIISQEVISENEVNIEVVDRNGNISSLSLKLLDDKKLSVKLNDQISFTAKKLSSKCLIPNLSSRKRSAVRVSK